MEGLAYEDTSERLTETKGLGRLQNWKAIRNAAWICIFQLSVCLQVGFILLSLSSLTSSAPRPRQGCGSSELSLGHVVSFKLSLWGVAEDTG